MKRSRIINESEGIVVESHYYKKSKKVDGELKFIDQTLNLDPISSTGNVATLALVVQGVDEEERIGRKITFQSIQWNYRLLLDGVLELATPRDGEEVRCIIFVDKQANGIGVMVDDILATTQFDSFTNLHNEERFDIIYDVTHTLNYTGLTWNANGFSQSDVRIDTQISLNVNVPIEYSGAAGVLSNVRSNNLKVLLISASNRGVLRSKFRFRYTDY